jgi:hypothetical protein
MSSPSLLARLRQMINEEDEPAEQDLKLAERTGVSRHEILITSVLMHDGGLQGQLAHGGDIRTVLVCEIQGIRGGAGCSTGQSRLPGPDASRSA